jgi:predicted nucleic acid-binding protein
LFPEIPTGHWTSPHRGYLGKFYYRLYMTKRYYLDTCIWRDHYENRTGFFGRKLGNHATNLFNKLMSKKGRILFSRLIYIELTMSYSEECVNDMLNLLIRINILEKVDISDSQDSEAKRIARERNLPSHDVLHAILARDNGAVIITQDKHFDMLKDIVDVKKPEEI